MLEKLNTLAISVTENPIGQPVEEPKNMLLVVVLAVITGICVVVLNYLPEMKAYFKTGKQRKQQKKINKARDEELERLHKIKKKNKRK